MNKYTLNCTTNDKYNDSCSCSCFTMESKHCRTKQIFFLLSAFYLVMNKEETDKA